MTQPACKNCGLGFSTKFHNVWEHRSLCNSCGPMFYTKLRDKNGNEYEESVEDIMEAARKRVALSQATAQQKMEDALQLVKDVKITSQYRTAEPLTIVLRHEELPWMSLTEEMKTRTEQLNRRYAEWKVSQTDGSHRTPT